MRHKNHLLSVPPLIALLLLLGCGKPEPAKDTQNEREAEATTTKLSMRSVRAIGITTLTAEERPLTGTLIAPMRLLPDQDRSAVVGSLVEGRVQRVLVNVGDVVTRGQDLMELVGLEIGAIKARFIKAKAHLTFAEAALKRQKILAEQNIGSQKTLTEAQAEYEKALAEFSAEDKTIHSIGLTDNDALRYLGDPESENGHIAGLLPVRAPIGGVITERNIIPGQLIDASTNAFRIVDADTLWADGQLYEKDLSLLGERPVVTLTVTAFPNLQFRGRVALVFPTIDEQTRMVTIRAIVPNLARKLKPQMFGEMHIPLAGAGHRLAVPSEAILTDNQSSYVFTAEDDSTFRRQNVQTGASSDGWTEILTGLQKGEKVVTKGSFQLKAELMRDSFGEEH